MFIPHTAKIEVISKYESHKIDELQNIFGGVTNVYIDYANVKPWSSKLGWHIDVKRLKQFLSSFSNVRDVSFYYGTLKNNPESNKFMKILEESGYRTISKPVKRMPIPLLEPHKIFRQTDVSYRFLHKGIQSTFPQKLLHDFQTHIKYLKQNGVSHIHDYKCNFDVEITWDLVQDLNSGKVSTFVLWSGDADFEFPVKELMKQGKRVVVFATARRVSSELSRCGARIYDIQKIRNFICWNKEINLKNAKETKKVSKLKSY